MGKSPSPIAVILAFIVLIAGFFAINTAPTYFTAVQKTIMYFVLVLVFGVILAYSMK